MEKVLWSRPSPAQPAPDTYVRPSSGWVFKGGVGNRHEYALAERPRIEVGHHYVIALAWSPAKCSEGDKPEPAQWVGLGEGSTVPYDEGVIGRGEMEGRQQAAAARESGVTALAAVEGKLEEKLAGRSADALVAALKTAEPSQNRATAPAARSLRGTCS